MHNNAGWMPLNYLDTPMRLKEKHSISGRTPEVKRAIERAKCLSELTLNHRIYLYDRQARGKVEYLARVFIHNEQYGEFIFRSTE